MSTQSFHGFGKFESSYSFTILILSSANVNEHSMHGSSEGRVDCSRLALFHQFHLYYLHQSCIWQAFPNNATRVQKGVK